MNRSMAAVGIGIILAGLALVAFPIVVTGREVFDLEQEAGFLIAPVGLAVVMIAAESHDPRKTTVAGTFGNAEEAFHRRVPTGPSLTVPIRRYNPKDPVRCAACRTAITYDLARCPRCARARECRSCGRPLGFVLDRATCPRCARPEAFCNCAALSDPSRLKPTIPPSREM